MTVSCETVGIPDDLAAGVARARESVDSVRSRFGMTESIEDPIESALVSRIKQLAGHIDEVAERIEGSRIALAADVPQCTKMVADIDALMAALSRAIPKHPAFDGRAPRDEVPS